MVDAPTPVPISEWNRPRRRLEPPGARRHRTRQRGSGPVGLCRQDLRRGFAGATSAVGSRWAWVGTQPAEGRTILVGDAAGGSYVVIGLIPKEARRPGPHDPPGRFGGALNPSVKQVKSYCGVATRLDPSGGLTTFR